MYLRYLYYALNENKITNLVESYLWKCKEVVSKIIFSIKLSNNLVEIKTELLAYRKKGNWVIYYV